MAYFNKFTFFTVKINFLLYLVVIIMITYNKFKIISKMKRVIKLDGTTALEFDAFIGVTKYSDCVKFLLPNGTWIKHRCTKSEADLYMKSFLNYKNK